MAKRLEDQLYRSAPTKEHYSDLNTLKQRLQHVALQMGARPTGPGLNGLDTPGADSSITTPRAPIGTPSIKPEPGAPGTEPKPEE